ncbi:MAG TPA: hypothetical protein GX497_08545 [Bacillus bacterium]|nr:hypothetical protein [Bacillus sp. (in: firmicutes)]
MNSFVGKKVKVYINGKNVERVLREDKDGLYIRFENERVAVRPELNCLDEVIPGAFIKIHTKKATADVSVKPPTDEVMPAQQKVLDEVESSFDKSAVTLNPLPALPYGIKVIDKAWEHMVFFYDFFRDAVAHNFPETDVVVPP